MFIQYVMKNSYNYLYVDRFEYFYLITGCNFTPCKFICVINR